MIDANTDVGAVADVVIGSAVIDIKGVIDIEESRVGGKVSEDVIGAFGGFGVGEAVG